MVDRANNIQAAFNPVYQLLKMGLMPQCENYNRWVEKVDRLKARFSEFKNFQKLEKFQYYKI